MNALLKHTPVMPILPVPTLTDPSLVSATQDTLVMDLIVLVRNAVTQDKLQHIKQFIPTMFNNTLVNLIRYPNNELDVKGVCHLNVFIRGKIKFIKATVFI